MGKHKPSYTSHCNCGDKVIVKNAETVALTGKKMSDKRYISYSGYPGGQKKRSAEQISRKEPAALLKHAIVGMLKKTRLRKEYFKNILFKKDAKHIDEKLKKARPINMEKSL